MAETKTVKLEVKSNVDEVTAEFKKTGDAINKTTQDVKNFNDEAIGGTDDIVKGQEKVQKSIKQTGKDVKKAGDGFKQFKGAADGLKGGFETAEGAMELFGAETEVVGEAIGKVQQVMSLSEGIKGLKAGVGAWKTFGKSAMTAIQGMGKALIATGIGAIVVAVGLLVAYWDDIAAAMGGAAAEGQILLDQSIEQRDLAEEKYNASVKYEDILRAQGKSEKFIRDLQMEELNLAIEKAKVAVKNAKQQKDLAIQSAEFNQMVLEGVLKVLLFPLDQIVRTYNAIAKYVPGLSPMGLLSTQIAQAVFSVEDAAAEADQKIKDAETALKDLELQKSKIELKEKAERASRYKAAEKQKEEHEKRMAAIEQKRRDDNLKEWENYLKAIEEADENEYQRKLTDRQKDEESVRTYYFNLTAQAEAHLETLDENDKDYLYKKELLQEQILNLKRQEGEEMAAIEKEYQDQQTLNELSNAKELQDLKMFLMAEGQAKEILELENSYAEKFELAKNNAELTLELEQDLANKREGIEQQYQQAKVGLAVKGFASLGKLVEAFSSDNEKDAEKQFKVQKAFNIATAIANTGLAVTAALTAGGNPVKLATGIQFVEAGIAAATGLANVATIAKTKFEKGGGGSADTGGISGGDGAGAVAPSFNIVGDSGINDLEGLGETPPIQAFVTSQDVTTAQGLDRARIENATI